MSLRVLSRSFRVPVTRLPVIPITRSFSTSTHSFMERPKPPSTSVIEPTMSSSSMSREVDEDWEATNSDADTASAPQSQLRGMSTMSMADEEAKERMDMEMEMETTKDDWAEEVDAMAQDTRGTKPPVDTDYM